MRENPVKRTLRAGHAVVGTWLNIGSIQSAEAMAALGYDFLVVDAEHSPIDWATAAAMFAAAAHFPVAPLVRLPWNSEEHVKRALDAGAWGIVFANIQSAEEARAMVAAAKYPPVGTRSLGQGRHALAFETDAPTYFARANDEIVLVMQIEHWKGVEAADEILAVPGVDASFLGPNDLCASMGLPPALEPAHPEFDAAVQRIFAAAKTHGVAPGIHVATPETANRRLREGWRFVSVLGDLRMMLSRAEEIRGAIRTGP